MRYTSGIVVTVLRHCTSKVTVCHTFGLSRGKEPSSRISFLHCTSQRSVPVDDQCLLATPHRVERLSVNVSGEDTVSLQ